MGTHGRRGCARGFLGTRFQVQNTIRVSVYVIRVRVSARVSLRASSAPFPLPVLPVWFGCAFILAAAPIPPYHYLSASLSLIASTYWWQQHLLSSRRCSHRIEWVVEVRLLRRLHLLKTNPSYPRSSSATHSRRTSDRSPFRGRSAYSRSSTCPCSNTRSNGYPQVACKKLCSSAARTRTKYTRTSRDTRSGDPTSYQRRGRQRGMPPRRRPPPQSKSRQRRARARWKYTCSSATRARVSETRFASCTSEGRYARTSCCALGIPSQTSRCEALWLLTGRVSKRREAS